MIEDISNNDMMRKKQKTDSSEKLSEIREFLPQSGFMGLPAEKLRIQNFNDQQKIVLCKIAEFYKVNHEGSCKLDKQIAEQLTDDEKIVFDYAHEWHLWVAIENGNEERVNYLLEKNALNSEWVNTPTDSGDTFLHQAVRYKQDSICRLLLGKGANPSIKNSHGEYPFGEVRPHQPTPIYLALEQLGRIFIPINKVKIVEVEADIRNLLNQNFVDEFFIFTSRHSPSYNMRTIQGVVDLHCLISFQKENLVDIYRVNIERELGKILSKKIKVHLPSEYEEELQNLSHFSDQNPLTIEESIQNDTLTLDEITKMGHAQQRIASDLREVIVSADITPEMIHKSIAELTEIQIKALIQLGQYCYGVYPTDYQEPSDSVWTLLNEKERSIVRQAEHWNLHYAIRRGDIAMVRELLNRGLEVNEPYRIFKSGGFGESLDPEIYQAAMIAISSPVSMGDYSMCLLLLKRGADPEAYARGYRMITHPMNSFHSSGIPRYFDHTRRPEQSGENSNAVEIRNAIGGRHIIDDQHWAVSIVRKKDSYHAFLIIEGKKSTDYFVQKADLVVQTNNNPLQVISSQQRAIIEVIEISDIKRLRRLDEQSSYKSWAITARDGRKMLDNIANDQNSHIAYNIMGDGELYTSTSWNNRSHNCLSWAKEKLTEIGIDPGKNQYESFVVLPNVYLPDPIDEEKNSTLHATGWRNFWGLFNARQNQGELAHSNRADTKLPTQSCRIS